MESEEKEEIFCLHVYFYLQVMNHLMGEILSYSFLYLYCLLWCQEELALNICLINKPMNFRSGKVDNDTSAVSIHTFPSFFPVILSHENSVSSHVLSFLLQ